MPMELYHHGVKGQKWGVRRFQNRDGTLTAKGKSHIRENDEPEVQKKKGLSDKQKKALKIGATVLGTALVAYGSYKVVTSPKTHALVNRVLNGSKEKRMADISKAIDNMGPEIVRKNTSHIDKVASEASKLARSVTAAGPALRFDTVNKPNTSATTSVVRSVTSQNGAKTFIDASKANDDLVKELLKKNTLKF